MKTKEKVRFPDLLKSLNVNQYVQQDVAESVTPCKPQKLEFFNLGRLMTCEELDGEFAKRGLEAASPYALALYAKEHPDFADEKSICTQWKDAKGAWYYATFRRWRGERDVRVSRNGIGWNDDWWAAGLRKSLALGHSSTSNSDAWPSELDLTVTIGANDYKGKLKRV